MFADNLVLKEYFRWKQGQGTQPFVLANGDPTGYSLHADFVRNSQVFHVGIANNE